MAILVLSRLTPPLPPFIVQKKANLGGIKTTSKLLDTGWTPPLWTMSERKTLFYGFPDCLHTLVKQFVYKLFTLGQRPCFFLSNLGLVIVWLVLLMYSFLDFLLLNSQKKALKPNPKAYFFYINFGNFRNFLSCWLSLVWSSQLHQCFSGRPINAEKEILEDMME